MREIENLFNMPGKWIFSSFVLFEHFYDGKIEIYVVLKIVQNHKLFIDYWAYFIMLLSRLSVSVNRRRKKLTECAICRSIQLSVLDAMKLKIYYYEFSLVGIDGLNRSFLIEIRRITHINKFCNSNLKPKFLKIGI